MAFAAAGMSVLVMGPFINVLAWRGGLQWLGAYGVLVAVAIASTALAVALDDPAVQAHGAGAHATCRADRGGRRRRHVRHRAAGRGHAVDRNDVASRVPDLAGRPCARARHRQRVVVSGARGHGRSVIARVRSRRQRRCCSLAITARYAPRFADYALTASSRAHEAAAPSVELPGIFRVAKASTALWLKERKLLLRDPWLISQSLMQLLYLIPPAVLLWSNLGRGSAASIVLVPVLIMTAGQLAGGLAWLTISGEDAPDLVVSAPVHGLASAARQDRSGDAKRGRRAAAVSWRSR